MEESSSTGFSVVLFAVVLLAIYGALVLINAWLEQKGFLEQNGKTPELNLPKTEQAAAQDTDTKLADSFLVQQFTGLKLNSFGGQSVNLADFGGKALVLSSWASWCPLCKQQLSDLNQVQRQFGEQVQVIAINRQENASTAKSFSNEVVTDSRLILLLDANDGFYKNIGGILMPETLFINRTGQLVEQKRGLLGKDALNQKIQELLARQ